MIVVKLSNHTKAEQAMLKKHGKSQGLARVEIDESLLANILKKPQTMPEPKWSLWAITLAAMKQDGDIGLGDTAERVFGKFGGSLFKSAVKKMGMNCGCGERKEDWNRRFRYLPPNDLNAKGK